MILGIPRPLLISPIIAGYLRFTKDVDIVVQLVPENIERAFAALITAGYRPSVPIAAAQFANVEMRGGWIRDKNMQVLATWEGARREQLRRWAELPLESVIAALEEMDELARQFAGLKTAGPATD